jgi:hypothetical protein
MKSIGIDINGKEMVLEGEWAYCHNNHLTSLVLNEGCKEVYCHHNHQLTSLVLNEGCERVSCDNIDLFGVNPDIEINILNYIK